MARVKRSVNAQKKRREVLEAASGYRWRHGDGVAAGMMVASRLSLRRGLLREEDFSRLDRLLTTLRIPHRVDMAWEEIAPFVARDKKFRSGAPLMVLPRSDERCALLSVSLDELREACEESAGGKP